MSVPVQVTDWKDTSPKWPVIVLTGTLNPTRSLNSSFLNLAYILVPCLRHDLCFDRDVKPHWPRWLTLTSCLHVVIWLTDYHWSQLHTPHLRWCDSQDIRTLTCAIVVLLILISQLIAVQHHDFCFVWVDDKAIFTCTSGHFQPSN